MKYIEVEVPEKNAYVLPIGDLHIGDKSFTAESLELVKKYLKWVDERPNARIVLVGDIFNCATRGSKTSPFEQKDNELQLAIDLFKPYADKIVAAIDGNHEGRLEDFANYSIMNAFCIALGIPYCKYSVVVNFKVHKRPDEKRFREQYLGYFHHTTGGGSTIGSKLNRVAKLTEIVGNADFYVGAHNHQLGAAPLVSQFADVRQKKVVQKRQWLIDAGSYLEWDDAYPEKMGLRPTKLGSARIRLDGGKHDVHVSL